MTKYILHGGFSRKDNDSNRMFFSQFVQDVPEGGTVLLVYFASEEEDDDVSKRFQNHRDQINTQAMGKALQFELAVEENFMEQVERADAIYFNGGDTNRLLATLKQFPDFATELEGKTVAGSSAGAYALSTYGTAHSEDHIRRGLGLLPVRIVCHHESLVLPPSPSSLAEIANTAPELELVFLKDYEWKVFRT